MSVQSNLAQAILSSWLSGATGASGTGFSSLKKKKVKYSRATCPDLQCGAILYFPTHELSVECSGCGQRHSIISLSDRQEVKEEEHFQRSLSEMKLLYGGKKTPELVKVKGISNYQCKLLSSLLTTYGKDRNDKARLLKDLGLDEVFDCSKLGGRVFAIEPNLLDTAGYGQDKSGSLKYLSDTLDQLAKANGNKRCLVPVHADGDGHCLVHAVSRCLVGRELFWHALRVNMQTHLKTHGDKYISMLKDFLSEEEWPEIVEEAGPDYQPPDGQPLGLRTVHIFALANVLHRPIILLDNLAGMEKRGEYSGIFLPSLHTPEECCTQGVLNSPIVIAWSNSAYNHFIPLVPLRDQQLPKLPNSLRPEVWGVGDSLLTNYIKLEPDGSIELCRGKPLQDTYLHKLVSSMEELFVSLYGVTPSLVADFNQHVYRSAGCVSVSAEMVTMETKYATEDGRLFRCLLCAGLSHVPADWLCKDGRLYNIAVREYTLKNGEKYTFPTYGITAEYNAEKDILIPTDVDCFHCTQTSRRIHGDGTVQYENGDRTPNRANTKFSKCCGYKHYWDGKEYDNLPEVYPLQLTWKGRPKTVKVYWFQNESDPSLNSNMYEVASEVVTKHYPGEFGDEQIVQQVVEMLLSATESKSSEQVEHHGPNDDDNKPMETDSHQITKTIITGMTGTTKTLHKEELGVSEIERRIKRKVEEKVAQQLRKQALSTKPVRKTSPSPSSRDKPSSSPPAKISATDRNNSPTPKPSPPSPSAVSDGKKRIKVTTSDGKVANLTLSQTATFTDLQNMIENQLSIPVPNQRLRWGFPPKELHPSEDPSSPLKLSHGERVSVEWAGQLVRNIGLEDNTMSSVLGPTHSPINKSPTRSPKSKEAPASITDQLRSLIQEVDAFDQLQHQPRLFVKGGHCYEELQRSYGKKLHDGMHVQFAEMTDIVFRYNASEERLEVCLGVEHIPVGPLTRDQRELAKLAATQAKGQEHKIKDSEGIESVKWLLNRPSSGSNVKAFSGTGHTLGGGGGGGGADFLSSVSDSKQTEASYRQTLLNAAHLIASSRIKDLQMRELQLQSEVRALNQQLLDADSNRQDDEEESISLINLETKLIDLSSELKQIREEIKELSEL